MVGKPVIKGTRLTVTFVLGLLSHGMTIPEILGEYHHVTADDIYACIDYASDVLNNIAFIPLSKRAA